MFARVWLLTVCLGDEIWNALSPSRWCIQCLMCTQLSVSLHICTCLQLSWESWEALKASAVEMMQLLLRQHVLQTLRADSPKQHQTPPGWPDHVENNVS